MFGAHRGLSSLPVRRIVPYVTSLLCALGLFLVGTADWGVGLASAGELWVSDETVLDPGIRCYDPNGFRTRLDFCNVDGELTFTWSEPAPYGGEAQILFLGEDGQSGGEVWSRNPGPGVSVVQALPLASGGWGVLESHSDTGLRFGRHVSLWGDPEDAIVLDTGPVVDRLVGTECIDGEFLFVWGSEEGEVKRARVSSEFLLLGEVETLGTYSGGVDLEFGADGGIIAWTTESGISFLVLEPDGNDLDSVRSFGVVSTGEAFSAARIGDHVVFFHMPDRWPERPRLVVADAGTGMARESHVIDMYVDRDSQIASGPEGALVVGYEGASILLDAGGRPVGETFESLPSLWAPVEEDGHWVDAIWTGSAYLVGASSLIVEVSPEGVERTSDPVSDPASDPSSDPDDPAARYCYVVNRALGRTVTPAGTLGPELTMNEGFVPTTCQPWFSGDALHVLLEDRRCREQAQMRVPEDGTPIVVHGYGGPADNCDTYVGTRMGVAGAGELVTVRWSLWTSRWGDYEIESTTIDRYFGDGSVRSSHPAENVGNDWNVALVGGEPWIVSDYRPYGEERATRVWAASWNEPRELDPPASGRSQILDLHGRPYVIWHQGTELYGAFVPGPGEGPLTGTLLHEGSDLYLHSAAEGGPGALVVLRDTQTNGEPGLFALPLDAEGNAPYPAALVAPEHALNAHTVWVHERFFIAWNPPRTLDTVRVARVGTRGTVYDPGGIEIEGANGWAPILAVGTSRRIALTYGGDRVRFLADDLTPLVATGPFVEPGHEGVELTWTVGEGRVVRAEIERAPVEGSGSGEGDDADFETIGVLAGSPVLERFVDTSAESERRYLYQVRLLTSEGESRLLGPVEATRPGQGIVLSTGLSLWPNPTRGRLELSLGAAREFDRVEIVDVLGRIRVSVPRPELASTGDRVSTWDLTEAAGDLPSGTYWVRVVGPDGIESRAVRIVR